MKPEVVFKSSQCIHSHLALDGNAKQTANQKLERKNENKNQILLEGNQKIMRCTYLGSFYGRTLSHKPANGLYFEFATHLDQIMSIATDPSGRLKHIIESPLFCVV